MVADERLPRAGGRARRPRPARRLDIGEFATLAKRAKRYGLLVLHWAEHDTETFVVQDEGVIYRYGTRPSLVWPAPPSGPRESTHLPA